MTTSFVARFDTTPKSLLKILNAIEPVLYNHKITYANSIIKMVSHNEWPTIENLDFQNVSLSDVVNVAESWWGIGLSCVSQMLVNALGRNAASEVDLCIFRGPKNNWTMHYSEQSSAADYRIKTEDANQELIALQIDLCQAAGFKLSIYEEEDTEKSPTVTIRNVETTVKKISTDVGSESSMVVSTELMTLDKARKLAGSRADEVRESLQGFILFPFLTGFS